MTENSDLSKEKPGPGNSDPNTSGEDGNTYFIHQSKLNGEHIDSGYYVSFKPFQNDRSDYNAKNIMVIEAPERKRKYAKAHKKHE